MRHQVSSALVTCLLLSAATAAEVQAQKRPTAAARATSRPSRSVAAKLTTKDAADAAALFDLRYKGSKLIDECENEAGGPELKDLNMDGRSEAIFYDGMCLGGNAGFVGIAARKQDGGWKVIFSDQGVLEILKTRRGGWPDLRVGKPGLEAPPVYHWLGSRYDYTTGNADDSPIANGPSKPTAAANSPMDRSSAAQAPQSAARGWGSPADEASLLNGTFSFPASAPAICIESFSDDNLWTVIRLRNAKDWSGLIRHSLSKGCGSDAAFFDVGRSLMNLGRPDLAVVYLRRSLALSSAKETPKELVCKRVKTCGMDLRSGTAEILQMAEGLNSSRSVVRQASVSQQGGMAAQSAAVVGAATSSVWALGRVRILVERGRSCGVDESLGKAFCFGEAITWLRRRPQKTEVDVIAMDNAFVPGSMVPYNSGRGWSVFRTCAPWSCHCL